MDPMGLSAVVVVLAAATGIGWWRRRSDGTLRSPAGPASGDPLPRSAADPASAGPARAGQDGLMNESGARIDPALLKRLGVEPAPATLLQFSTAFCAPCRALRRVSAEVTALLPEVRHVEVDAESHLDEVRALGIWRTPTLLILDAEGREVRRATGVPAKPHLIAALALLLPTATSND